MKMKKILSLLVAMVMALSCVGITAMAEESSTVVAKVGETTYASLADAISNAGAGQTVTLVKDIVGDGKSLTISKDITLDLGGCTFTDAYIITSANVTIKNGSIKNTKEPYPIKVTGNTLTVEDITLEYSASDRAIWVDGGTLNFNNSSILATKGENNSKSKIYGIWVSKGTTANIYSGSITVDAGPDATAVAIFGNYVNTVNVYGGKISTSGKNYSYAIWTEGDVIITGGEIVTNEKKYGYSSGITYGKNYAINTKGNVTISGGTITTNGHGGYLVNAAGSEQKITVSEVEFTNVLTEIDKTKGGHEAPELIYGSPTTVEISSGQFDGVAAVNPEYVVPGATITVDGEKYIKTENGLEETVAVAKIGDIEYATLAEAVANIKENETITILAGTISEGTIKLPATLKNVTFKGEEGAILEDMTIMASDGNSFSYIGLTFDGITFDNSRLIFTGWRNGEEVIENLTITNCVFQNLIDDTNVACVHINKAASEPVNGFIFINNVIDGATGGSKSGIYTVNTGKVIITGNTFNNIVFRPALVQLADCDGTVDNVVVSNNVISNTTRLQIYGSEVENEDGTYTPVGTDTLAIAINDNIFQNITGYYICTWGINGKSDIAENYYDGDISGKIYWNNEKPADEAGLAEIGVYPYYTELNTDGTINTESLVEAPTNKVAKIGDTTFTTLQAAIDAANNGDTIVVLADMTFESDLADAGKGYFNIPDGKKVTIDLNEKTINVTENSAGNFILFYNYGELTIKNGTVNLTSIQNRGWNAESAIILNRGGILNVESGTFTHLGGTDMAFVVDNSGNWFGEATANIEGGSLTSSYIAIRNRMEQNEHGYSGTAYLNIAGGTISGNSRAVWAQASSTSEKSPATGVINVTGGNIGKIDTARSSGAVCMTTVSGGTVASFKVEKGELKITGGTVTGTLTILDASGNTVESDEIISGGTFSGDVKSYLADGCTLTANGDGTYSVERAGTLATENVLIQNMAQGTTATGDPTYRVGCFAAIDSANYSLLGIEVKADNGKVTGSGTTQYLYTYINVTNSKGEVTKILPETLGETNKYIFGRIMAFTTNYTDFSFRPFAVSLDGKTTFYGNWSKEYTVDPE